tara:strand:- start:3483 stop:3653 length:171 start_codon:yes stop_codon:yes gene_type:complete
MDNLTTALLADLQKDLDLVLNAKTNQEALLELHNLSRAAKLTQKLIIKINNQLNNN